MNDSLRLYTRFLVLLTFFLIFAGGMVTSTGSGLAVPDWPLSYGMLFPPMVGGVFYEHGHRLVATTVGLLTTILLIWVFKSELRPKVKKLVLVSWIAVCLQGVLGGLTVKFLLPLAVSTAHAIMGQTFFLLTIIIAYCYSKEDKDRFKNFNLEKLPITKVRTRAKLFLGLIYVQLLLGAVQRHAEAGLAVPDFPTMGGHYFPTWDILIQNVNIMRYNMDLDPVSSLQVGLNLAHRFGALVVLVCTFLFVYTTRKELEDFKKALQTLYTLLGLVLLQVLLGITVIWTEKHSFITSLHVVIGALILGLSLLFLLRTSRLYSAEADRA